MISEDYQFSYILSGFPIVVQSTVERGVIESPIIIVDLAIAPFSSISFCFTYFAALLLIIAGSGAGSFVPIAKVFKGAGTFKIR